MYFKALHEDLNHKCAEERMERKVKMNRKRIHPFERISGKELAQQFGMDLFSGSFIACGIYNFASAAGFPMAGVSGISLIFHRLFGTPIGGMSILLNVPIVLVCFRTLGKGFFLRSLRTLLVVSLLTDYAAPLLPVYQGERLLAAIAAGALTGTGYALVFRNQSSTGGMDFVTLSIRAKRPYLSMGKIVLAVDLVIVLAGGWIFRDPDGIIYGGILTWLMSHIIDQVMYGLSAGKMALIVTRDGKIISEMIGQTAKRGTTIFEAKGGYTGEEKQVVLCVASKKQMYEIQKNAREMDPNSFTVIVESNEVLGEGFDRK